MKVVLDTNVLVSGILFTGPPHQILLTCAVASGAGTIVSGDTHLLSVSGYRGIEVLRPRAFVEGCLAR